MLKWVYRMVKHAALLLLVKLPMQLIGMIVLAPVLLFIPKDVEVLPKYLRWFDNASTHRFNGEIGLGKGDGLSGDPPYRNTWKNPTGWLARYNWLALRNPVNYFQYYVLGISYKREDVGEVTWTGNRYASSAIFRPLVRNEENILVIGPPTDNEGLFMCEATINGKSYWEIYYVKNLTHTKCIRIRLGWKFNQSPFEDLRGYVLKQNHLQFTFNINPYATILRY